ALCSRASSCCCFHRTATSESYTLSLRDALPIFDAISDIRAFRVSSSDMIEISYESTDPGICMSTLEIISGVIIKNYSGIKANQRSEEHTSELQSREKLVCRLLLEKKKAGRESST